MLRLRTMAMAATIAVVLCARPAVAMTILKVSADRLTFYNDRYVVLGSGKVRVDFGSGRVISGDLFAMDLRLNRILVSGAVHVQAKNAAYDGSAFAENLDDGRAYLISVTPQPERAMFEHGDLAHATSAETTPQDAFTLPDVSGSTATFIARKVTIGTRSYLRFGSSRLDIASGFGVYFPIPSWYVNFANDPNLSQTALSPANAGGTLKFIGNAYSQTGLAINYDQTNKLYTAIQQNFATEKSWAVLSISPLTKNPRYWNAIGSDDPSNTFGVRGSGLWLTGQTQRPSDLSTSTYSTAQLTQSLSQAYLQLNYESTINTNQFDNSVVFIPHQTTNVQLSATTSDLQIGHLPLLGSARYGYGMVHDPYGLQLQGGVTYTSIWQQYAGASLYTQPLSLGDPSLNLILGAQKTYQSQSVPHYIDQTDTRASLSKAFGTRTSVFVLYDINNVKDTYRNGQRNAYPAFVIPQDPGYTAFEGDATFRTLQAGGIFTPSYNLAIAATFEKHTDFPQPVPNVFPQPTLHVLGQNPPPFYFGQPPYDVIISTRFRVTQQLSFDLQDTYYFNFGGLTWSGFQFQVLP